MSSSLQIDNFSSRNIKERSSLSADTTAGASTLTLINSQNFATSDPLLVGSPGSGVSEISSVTSVVSATSVAVNPLQLGHTANDQVLALYGDHINIYRAPNVDGTQPADSAFVLYTTDPIAMDPDQQTTLYTDPDGSGDDWYKFTYKNGTTGQETSLADSSSARGGGVGNYVGLDRIRKAAGFEHNTNISDVDIDEFRQTAQNEVNGRLTGVYQVPFVSPINPLISQITRDIAAGYLLLDQYGPYTATDTNNGQSRIDAAMKQLDKLVDGSLVLTNATGIAPALEDTASGFNAYPNATTATDGGSDFMFKRSFIDGYRGRHY